MVKTSQSDKGRQTLEETNNTNSQTNNQGQPAVAPEPGDESVPAPVNVSSLIQKFEGQPVPQAATKSRWSMKLGAAIEAPVEQAPVEQAPLVTGPAHGTEHFNIYSEDESNPAAAAAVGPEQNFSADNESSRSGTQTELAPAGVGPEQLQVHDSADIESSGIGARSELDLDEWSVDDWPRNQ